MTGPADRVLASAALLKEPSGNLQARHHKAHTATVSSALRRLSRRGALALLFGTAALVAVEQRVAFAVGASSSGGVATPRAAGAGVARAPPDATVTDAPATDAAVAAPAAPTTAAPATTAAAS